MSAMVLQAGELVDIAIKGARVEAYNGGYFTVAPTDGAHITIETGSVGVQVTRVAPAEWPPLVGDVWEDVVGSQWFTRYYEGEPYLVSTAGDHNDPAAVLASIGPMTLAYRKGWTPAPAADVDQADEAKPALDERAAKIAGLREMADWLEAHPELPLHKYTASLVLTHFVNEHGELERLAAVLGLDADPRTGNPHPGNPHRYARKTFSGGVKFEAVICGAYPEDPARGGEEVAGPVDAAGPATAPNFDLGLVPDADGDLIAPLTDEQIDTALGDLAGVLDANPRLLADKPVEHYMAGGTKGDPGECEAWCACGVTYSGFDTLGEASDHVEQHVANMLAAADDKPCDRTDLPEGVDMMCAGCGQRAGDHPAWRKRYGRHTPAVEQDPAALDQLGVAATDPGELPATMPELMSLGAPEDLPEQCDECETTGRHCVAHPAPATPDEPEVGGYWCTVEGRRCDGETDPCHLCPTAADPIPAPVVGDDTTGGEP